MTIVTITVANPANPTEIQAWFDNNPLALVKFLVYSDGLFYIVY